MMKRRFGWAMLVAAGIVFACAINRYESMCAAAAAESDAVAEAPDTKVVDQLKDIRTQLKEINTLLHSGTVKVVVVLNPDKP